MKMFVVKVMFFITLVLLVDLAMGPLMKIMRSEAKGGSTYKNYYIMEKSEDDILIFGASRACNHYIPKILMDSLGYSAYDCGESGIGIIGAYARYSAIAERHKPRLVVYDVIPNYDCYYSDAYSAFLYPFRPDANKKAVAELFNTFGDNTERIALLSNMYKNNSKLLVYIKDHFVPNDNNSGYIPNIGMITDQEIHRTQELCKVNGLEDLEVSRVEDSLKIYYLEKLFNKINSDGAVLVCIASPYFLGYFGDSHKPIIDLCERLGVPFLDYRNMSGISDRVEFFKNSGHLNDKGAERYTKELIPVLRALLPS